MSKKISEAGDILENAERQGWWPAVKTYSKYSGPGWLQSAITLGGGSLAGALFLGVVGGYSMLWVQLFALLMGVIMLSAIGYVSLSVEDTPFNGMRKRINPVLAWGWIIATLAANMVWVLPQYSLAYGALTENIAPGMIENPNALAWKMIISVVVMAVVIRVTFFYGKEGIGIKIYEGILKVIVGVIVLSFVGVVIKMGLSAEGLPFGEIAAGYIPDLSLISSPSAAYQEVLNTIGNEAAREFWANRVVDKQRAVLIAAASAAVGINMTFMLPYSMRAKGWGKKHRGLAIFDLSTGMVIPFVLATSCIVIASAHLFHGKAYEGVLVDQGGVLAITEDAKLSAQAGDMRKMLDARAAGEFGAAPVENGEMKMAAMLLNRSNKQFATSLETLVGANTAHFVFGIGVLGMALSTISVLMLISGFVVCEMFGYPHGGIHHKLGTLLGASGILWPFLWSGSSKAYLAIPTSVFGYTLLPVAFLAFFLMMNSKSLLGKSLPRGRSRFIWNTLMGMALLVTGTASVTTAWAKNMSIGGTVVPFGKIFLIGYGVAIVIGQIYMMRKNKASSPELVTAGNE